MSAEPRAHTSTFMIGDPEHGFHHNKHNSQETIGIAFVDADMRFQEKVISFIPGKTYRLYLNHDTCIVVGNEQLTHAIDDIEGNLKLGDIGGRPTYCFTNAEAACFQSGRVIHFEPDECVFIFPSATDRLELIEES